MAKEKSGRKDWTLLTEGDLEQWTDLRSIDRGRAYQQQGRVEDLAIDEHNRLLATVVGSRDYAVTVVATRQGRRLSLQSQCTCPVGHDGCKHAVATVFELIEALADEGDVPLAQPDDRRWNDLADIASEYGDEFDDESRAGGLRLVGTRSSPRARSDRDDEAIRAYLRGRSADELVEWLCSLAQRYPELREKYRRRPRFVEVLDTLQDRGIVKSRTTSRQRR